MLARRRYQTEHNDRIAASSTRSTRRLVHTLARTIAFGSLLGGCFEGHETRVGANHASPSHAVAGGGGMRFGGLDSSGHVRRADADAAVPDSPLRAALATRVGQTWAHDVAEAIEEGGTKTVRTRDVDAPSFDWIELDIYDQRFPIQVDIVACDQTPARGVVYMLPGGSINFRSSYFVRQEGLAAKFCRQGYLVVGISAREDHVPRDLEDTRFLQAWGMKSRREDIRSVITKVQSAVPAPYELVGHSWGAASALDYASVYSSELRRVIAMDIFSIDPDADPVAISRARRTYDAHVTLMERGVFADTSYADFSSVLRRGLDDSEPDVISFEYPDRYTSKELMLFGLIYSAVLPGVHTPLTGLPGDWPMAMSTLAGEYTRGLQLRDIDRILSRTQATTLRVVAKELGSGVMSMAFSRDYWAVTALDPAYTLRWQDITTEVIWLNSELGFAEKSYGANLVREAGNQRVRVEVIAGYGHADLLWGRHADEDVWQRLFD